MDRIGGWRHFIVGEKRLKTTIKVISSESDEEEESEEEGEESIEEEFSSGHTFSKE